LADYYEKETSYRMKNVIEVIQLSVSCNDVVLTALTLVSSDSISKTGITAYVHALAFPDSP